MKVCITSTGNNLESQIDPRFGRCQYFIVWDDANDTFEAIANPNIDAGSGAGIQSAQLVVTKKPSVLITGEVGPKAEKVLLAAKLHIITGESGSIKEIIEKYKDNKIKNTAAISQNIIDQETNIDPNNKDGVQKKFGLGCGIGRSMGKGRGRGFGRHG